MNHRAFPGLGVLIALIFLSGISGSLSEVAWAESVTTNTTITTIANTTSTKTTDANTADATSEEAASFPKERFRINLIPKGMQHLFWKLVVAGARQAATELNVELYVRAPGNDDNRKGQNLLLKSAIELDYDGIVLAPNHRDNYVDLVKQAVDRGIRVVVIDSAMSGGAHNSFVATDNFQAGKYAGQVLLNHLKRIDHPGDPQRPQVALFRYLKNNASTEMREQGFIDALKNSDIDIVYQGYVGASIGEAFRNILSIFERYPDLSGVFAPNESSSAGMLRALEYSQKLGSMAVVGFDFNDQLINAVETGHMQAIIIQQPFLMGYLGVRNAVLALTNKRYETYIAVPAKIVDQDNVNNTLIREMMNIR